MSKKAKVAVAAAIAALMLGGLAPVASARTTIWTQAERIVSRTDRNVQRVGRTVERETLELGQFLERTLNPR